jgi:hypothetical protein
MNKKLAWMPDPIREAQVILLKHLRQMPNATRAEALAEFRRRLLKLGLAKGGK